MPRNVRRCWNLLLPVPLTMRSPGTGWRSGLVFALVGMAILIADTSAARRDSVTLRSGEKRTTALSLRKSAENHLLWLRARIVLPAGEEPGAHALELALNGSPLTPENVKVLNKGDVRDRPGQVADDPRRRGRKIVTPPGPWKLFNAETGAWYIKADADWLPFNAQGQPGAPYTSMGGRLPQEVPQPNIGHNALENRGALVSHYYEYLFRLPEGVAAGENELTALARLPERLQGRSVELLWGLIPADHGIVTYHRPPVTEFVLVQQAPGLPDVVGEENGLEMAACAGEFEPTSVSLFALNPLENVTVSVEPLQPVDGGGDVVPPSAIQCYYLAQRLPHQQSKSRLPFTRDVEPDGVAPDLLIRQGEKPVAAGHPVSIPFQYWEQRRDEEAIAAMNARSEEMESTPGIPVDAMTSQRFLLDLKVPPEQAPGRYAGAVVLRAGERMLRRIPLRLTVHPFRLRQPRQKYWMWRQTWMPITEPGSVRAINMIGDAGMHGICRLAGMGLGTKVDRETGDATFDTAPLRAGKEILENAGLTTEYATNLVRGPFIWTCRFKYGIRPGNVRWFGYRFLPELADSPLDPDDYKPGRRDPDPEEVQTLREKLPRIEQDVIALLKKMRAKYTEVGVEPWHFAYDEPDGTAWSHPWVKWSNRMAHAAGFKTWSSHNDPLGWEAGIDKSVMGSVAHYKPMRIHAERFPGRTGSIGILEFGNFTGRLDEVHIYHRALTDEEILTQHRGPAKDGRTAHYPLDEARGQRAANAADSRVSDLILTGEGPGGWTQGVQGGALRFGRPPDADATLTPAELHERIRNAPADHSGKGPEREEDASSLRLKPAGTAVTGTDAEVGDGWAISFWYSGKGTVVETADGSVRFRTSSRGPRVELRTVKEDEAAEENIVLPDERGIRHDHRFWNHVTISVDAREGIVKYCLHNEAQREYYRDNVRWNYSQYRSFNPIPCRAQAGYCTWHMKELEHMTIFVFDLNFGIANLAWPEGGARMFNRPNTRWYPGLGLLAVREGVDDARYANTLYAMCSEQDGEKKAWSTVGRLFPGREVNWRKTYYQPALDGLTYNEVRDRLVDAILRKQ